MYAKQPFLDLDIIQLSAQNGAVHLDKQFILIDNFDDERIAVENEPFFVNHPVKLSFTVVIFCQWGEMRFKINLQDFKLHANDILIVQEGVIGEYGGMSPDARIAVIAFMDEYFQVFNNVEAAMSLVHKLYSSPLCHLRAEAVEECMTIYRLMKAKIMETDNPFRRGSLLGYMQVLAYNGYNYLLASDFKDDGRKVGRSQELYNRFIKEVQKNYTKQRSISYYAGVLCVTPKYLSQVVHKVSGRFASDWITDFVILEAKALLKSRKYTVQQVADMLNFANQSSFGVYFKKVVGCSPTAYKDM